MIFWKDRVERDLWGIHLKDNVSLVLLEMFILSIKIKSSIFNQIRILWMGIVLRDWLGVWSGTWMGAVSGDIAQRERKRVSCVKSCYGRLNGGCVGRLNRVVLINFANFLDAVVNLYFSIAQWSGQVSRHRERLV